MTLKSLRRLLEADLQLPEKALDEEPHKSAIKALVDQARARCRCWRFRMLCAPRAESNSRAARS